MLELKNISFEVEGEVEKKPLSTTDFESAKGEMSAASIMSTESEISTKSVMSTKSGRGYKDNKKEIIKDINISIKDDEFVVITGPNGGGKSTLVKVIAGIVKPSSGRIIFDGIDITEMGITERAKLGIGFAFQQPVKFKGITVKKLIQLAAGKNITTSSACSYLSEVGLCARDYINREVNASLSGGELKRIEIATIIARSTKLSLFDEPEAGIDLWSFNNLIRVFEKMHEEIKGSIVIISHQERILNIADRIVVIADGKIANQGLKDEILPELLEDSAASCRYYR